MRSLSAARWRRRARRRCVAGLDLTPRDAEQRIKRVQRGAEREELLASLEELAAWYRDLVVVASGAEGTVTHADRLDDLRADVARDLGRGPEHAAALVRESWRSAEEFNVNSALWLDSLFVQLRRAFADARLSGVEAKPASNAPTATRRSVSLRAQRRLSRRRAAAALPRPARR